VVEGGGAFVRENIRRVRGVEKSFGLL